jgi:hypothetical protein
MHLVGMASSERYKIWQKAHISEPVMDLPTSQVALKPPLWVDESVLNLIQRLLPDVSIGGGISLPQ